MDTSAVTRFEVIDHRSEDAPSLRSGVRGVPGRVLVAGTPSGRPVSVDLELQDDGCTLKVFLNDWET